MNILTVHIEGDCGAFASWHSLVCGHTAEVSSGVALDRLDWQVAACGHSLPVWQNLLMADDKHKCFSRLSQSFNVCFSICDIQ